MKQLDLMSDKDVRLLNSFKLATLGKISDNIVTTLRIPPYIHCHIETQDDDYISIHLDWDKCSVFSGVSR